MRRRWLLATLLIAMVVLAISLWQVPALLRAIPSRYVARLPEPIQTLGAREQVELLPTSAINSDLENLLSSEVQAASAEPTIDRVPLTPTPPPTKSGRAISETTNTPTATPSVTPTIAPTPTPVTLPPAEHLTGVEHRIQTWNNCGPATLSMALSYFDLFHTQEQIASVIKPDPEDRNVTPEEMQDYVVENTELSALSRANGDLQTLRHLVSENIPVIIEFGLQPEDEYRWLEWMGHYLLVVAYDDEKEAIWVYDSWPRTGEIPDENFVFEELEISYEVLDRHWKQFNRNYIALFEPEQAEVVANIVGEDMDDDVMWRNALQTVQLELYDEADNAFLWFNLGTIFNSMGEYERAASAFDQARSIGLPWRILWYQFGPYEAYYETGRYNDVIVLADITLKDRPYFEESFYYKALAQIELGDIEEARRNLQKAVDFNPNFVPASIALEELEVASN